MRRASHNDFSYRFLSWLLLAACLTATVAQPFSAPRVFGDRFAQQTHGEHAAVTVARPHATAAQLPGYKPTVSLERATTAATYAVFVFVVLQSLLFLSQLAAIKFGYHGHVATTIPPPPAIASITHTLCYCIRGGNHAGHDCARRPDRVWRGGRDVRRLTLVVGVPRA